LLAAQKVAKKVAEHNLYRPTLGEGRPKASQQGLKDAIFSWREIVQCFWATGFFLAGNRMTIVAFEKEVSLKA